MSTSYHIKLPNGAIVTFGSPEAIKESLEVHWPSGRYDIHEGSASGMPHGRAARRWGIAIKETNGGVNMVADPTVDR
jgi:hypothetical protein